MTITLLAPDGVPVTAQQERQANAALYGGGHGRPLGGRSGFRIDTPSNILTATSTTWTLQPCSAMLDPGASTHQGMYGWSSDAAITGAVTAADSTNPRKDLIYIRVNDSTAGDGSGAVNANVVYVAGVPGANPVAPALPARSFEVGTLDVPVAGGGAPVVKLNPARFVAAGARGIAVSAADRPVAPHVGQEVIRTDRNNHVQRWNGTAWKWVSEPERYFENASVFNAATSTSDMVIRTMPTTLIPVRSYATRIKVRAAAAITSGAISNNALRLVFAASAGVSTVQDAQGKAYLGFVAPGQYFESAAIETDWINIGGGGQPSVRCWIERIMTSTVTHQVALAPNGSGYLEALVLPADD
jgi:hypothetical protein